MTDPQLAPDADALLDAMLVCKSIDKFYEFYAVTDYDTARTLLAAYTADVEAGALAGASTYCGELADDRVERVGWETDKLFVKGIRYCRDALLRKAQKRAVDA